MKQHTDLYQSLLQELQECSQTKLPVIRQIENCFIISSNYNLLLRTKKSFLPEEDIQFYKETWPRFASHIEFYGFCYHAELFKQEMQQEPDRLQYFWLREAARLAKFKNEFSSFYQYYRSGRTDMDAAYFTSEGTYPQLTSTLLALERYHKHVIQEM